MVFKTNTALSTRMLHLGNVQGLIWLSHWKSLLAEPFGVCSVHIIYVVRFLVNSVGRGKLRSKQPFSCGTMAASMLVAPEDVGRV